MAGVILSIGKIYFTVDAIPKNFEPTKELGINLIPYKGYPRECISFDVTPFEEDSLRTLLDPNHMTPYHYLRVIGVDYPVCVGFTLVESRRREARRSSDR
jgi:hypothetical protein